MHHNIWSEKFITGNFAASVDILIFQKSSNSLFILLIPCFDYRQIKIYLHKLIWC